MLPTETEIKVFEAEDLRDWRGSNVVDTEGSKIGSLEAVYYDTASQQADFATVKVGLPGAGKLIFVPLRGATVAPKHVRVQTTKKQAKGAPAIDPDGELTAAEEPSLYEYYGLAYTAGASGERRLGRR